MKPENLTQTINDLITKLRTILGHNPRFRDLMTKSPSVKLSYDVDNGTYKIEEIKFPDWDRVAAYPFGCFFEPEHGDNEKLIEYETFDELLKI